MAEPVRETFADNKRERLVGREIERIWPNLVLSKTPPFHPTDYHVSRLNEYAELEYLNDLEIKWFNHSSARPAMFNFNKLQMLCSMPPKRERVNHMICFRFTDGLLFVPVNELINSKPYWFTRKDTQETDLVVVVDKSTLIASNSVRWLDRIVNERG